jgi:hypothetical protein
MNAEAEVDELLVAWEDRLRRVDENLVALESEPVYELLSRADEQKSRLEGVTRQKVEPALRALGDLFEHRARLTEVVLHAREIRANLSFWDKEKKLGEIRELLYGPSIVLASPPRPLAERGLLDAATSEVRVVPDRLLDAMSEAFVAARDAVTLVGQAWSRLEPVMVGAEGELASVEVLAREVGLSSGVAAEIEWLERELGRVRAAVAKDPLGIAAVVDAGLLPRLRELRLNLEEQKARRMRVEDGISAALEIQREAGEIHAAAREAIARAATEITGVVLPPLSDDALVRGLDPWRQKIEEAARAGRFGPAETGLERWTETARAYMTQDRAVLAKVLATLAERAELAGRLAARRAQENALSSRGATVDPKIHERRREAETLVYARPVSLAEAARALSSYEAELVKLAARDRGG